MIFLMLEEDSNGLFVTSGQTVLVPSKWNAATHILRIVRRQKVAVNRFEKEDAANTKIKILRVLPVFFELCGHAFERGAIG